MNLIGLRELRESIFNENTEDALLSNMFVQLTFELKTGLSYEVEKLTTIDWDKLEETYNSVLKSINPIAFKKLIKVIDKFNFKQENNGYSFSRPSNSPHLLLVTTPVKDLRSVIKSVSVLLELFNEFKINAKHSFFKLIKFNAIFDRDTYNELHKQAESKYSKLAIYLNLAKNFNRDIEYAFELDKPFVDLIDTRVNKFSITEILLDKLKNISNKNLVLEIPLSAFLDAGSDSHFEEKASIKLRNPYKSISLIKGIAKNVVSYEISDADSLPSSYSELSKIVIPKIKAFASINTLKDSTVKSLMITFLNKIYLPKVNKYIANLNSSLNSKELDIDTVNKEFNDRNFSRLNLSFVRLTNRDHRYYDTENVSSLNSELVYLLFIRNNLKKVVLTDKPSINITSSFR